MFCTNKTGTHGAVHCILLFAFHKPDTESATGGTLQSEITESSNYCLLHDMRG